MSNITVVASVTAKAAAVEQVKDALLQMVLPTRQEEGCLEYRLHQDRQDPSQFLFYENWTDMAALERHLASPHYLSYAAAVSGLLADKTVRTMVELA